MIYTRLLLLLSVIITFNFASAKSLEVFVANRSFFAPEIGTYVETDILIPGSSINYVKKENGKYQGVVEVKLLLKQKDEIKAVEKYRLNTIELDDTTAGNLSIIDKKRFVLPNGLYALEASFKDVNSAAEAKQLTESVLVDIDADKVQISDISLVDNYYKSNEQDLYTKSGLYMVPYVVNFYPEKINTLSFYAEVYHTDKIAGNDKFLIVSSIKKGDSEKVMGNLFKYQKVSAQPVHAVFASMDISSLPSGNYDLVIEVKDQKNNLVSVKKLFFFRSNPVSVMEPTELSKMYVENSFVETFTKENLVYQLKSMNPISTAAEHDQITELIKSKDILAMKKFFLNFWMTRNPGDPYFAWYSYSQEVNKVNQNYYTNLEYGFETDRGRVYLQYGPPSEIIQSSREPGADPYEIWTYYKLSNGQTDVKFVFHNADLVTNNYLLIHSTANGEVKNEYWQRVVHGSFVGGNSPTERNTEIRDHFGSKATENYDE